MLLNKEAEMGWKQDPSVKSRAKVAESLLAALERGADQKSGPSLTGRQESQESKAASTRVLMPPSRHDDTAKRTRGGLDPPHGQETSIRAHQHHQPAGVAGGGGDGERRKGEEVRGYVGQSRAHYDDPLHASTPWTCFGAYRP